MRLVINLYFKPKYLFKNLFAQKKIKRGCSRMFISLYVSTRFFYFYTINYMIPRTCIRIDKNIIKLQVRTLHNFLLKYFFKSFEGNIYMVYNIKCFFKNKNYMI